MVSSGCAFSAPMAQPAPLSFARASTSHWSPFESVGGRMPTMLKPGTLSCIFSLYPVVEGIQS